MSRPPVTVFAGPSTYGMPADLRPSATYWLPPARRGDVARIVDEGEPAVLVLCDGIFDAVPAVSHAELCHALDSGWQVWGVASLGAIRAWELRGEGMRGFGDVYATFERMPDLTDDEMCLLHCPEEPYFPVTEALINVRIALEEHGADCNIDARAATHLIARLGALWFGDRSEALIEWILVEELGITAPDCARWLTRLRVDRVKNRDLAELLRVQPWLLSGNER
jgi:hypothetical protein